MLYTSAKETWDKLKRIYEGHVKVKEPKLQKIRGQFEGPKMKEEEKIVEYIQRVDEVLNSIRGLRENVIDEVIVKKVMRSLTTRYDTKVSALEEAKDLKNFSMDELFGSLSSYEMRIIGSETSKREASYNTTKNRKYEVANVEEDDSDATIAKFARKLKKGSGKYKVKLPFNYGKI